MTSTAIATDTKVLQKLAQRIRYDILTSTTQAGSGHPTSALSATDLMTGLFFGGSFRFDADHPEHPNNDRLIFSKGHASPLLYALWAAAGKVSHEELMTYRHFGSRLEGHPSVAFPYVDAATGSLGQGLSIGVGMAINAKYLDRLPYRTYVLLGDSEMAEGSQWESIQLATHYRLDNLVGILDVNRLGQRGETMYGYDLYAYQERIEAFGWATRVIDGHDFSAILDAYHWAADVSGKPAMIIAKTIKGKGVPLVENKNGWHGKVLDEDQLQDALEALGPVDTHITGAMSLPENEKPEVRAPSAAGQFDYELGASVATRNAYGNALKRIADAYPTLVALDGEVSNSTRAAFFKDAHPERFFEMYIAEQNMVGAALGLACRGKIPFVSSFAAFLTRAYDQIRMSQYSDTNIKFVGSHAGVSIGQDGPSQMGLEDIAMFRAILGSVVLYPCDAVSADRLVESAAGTHGIAYLRMTREGTPVIYGNDEEFHIGGCKVLRKSDHDVATVVAAGVTLHEALAAYEELKKQEISVRVIDLYSVKPLDDETLRQAARETGLLVTVEDHFAEGGLADGVRTSLAATPVPVISMCVRKKPKSGQPDELLDYEGISASSIVKQIQEAWSNQHN